jgi:hypothetical protein
MNESIISKVLFQVSKPTKLVKTSGKGREDN